MKKPEKICLSCRHFHLADTSWGKCRVDRARIDKNEYPLRRHGETCACWQDGGQQYYIRVGWLKNQNEKAG